MGLSAFAAAMPINYTTCSQCTFDLQPHTQAQIKSPLRVHTTSSRDPEPAHGLAHSGGFFILIGCSVTFVSAEIWLGVYPDSFHS